VAKKKIRIALPTLIFFTGLFISDISLFSLIPFFASLFHELGHIAAMSVCGEKISNITILPFGIDIKRTSNFLSYKNDIFINSAGIITNLILCLLAIRFPKTKESLFFIQSNILLICINILPIRILDGGQITEKTLLLFLSPDKTDRIMNFLSFGDFVPNCQPYQL